MNRVWNRRWLVATTLDRGYSISGKWIFALNSFEINRIVWALCVLLGPIGGLSEVELDIVDENNWLFSPHKLGGFLVMIILPKSLKESSFLIIDRYLNMIKVLLILLPQVNILKRLFEFSLSLGICQWGGLIFMIKIDTVIPGGDAVFWEFKLNWLEWWNAGFLLCSDA